MAAEPQRDTTLSRYHPWPSILKWNCGAHERWWFFTYLESFANIFKTTGVLKNLTMVRAIYFHGTRHTPTLAQECSAILFQNPKLRRALWDGKTCLIVIKYNNRLGNGNHQFFHRWGKCLSAIHPLISHGYPIKWNHVFPQQQNFAMGSLAQISSGAIRCSFNTRFRTRSGGFWCR